MLLLGFSDTYKGGGRTNTETRVQGSCAFMLLINIVHAPACVCVVHAGLVLMYESGIVVLDLADTAVGWLDGSDEGSFQAKSRCESPLLNVPAADTLGGSQHLCLFVPQTY